MALQRTRRTRYRSGRSLCSHGSLLSGVGLWRHPSAPRFLSWWGVATGILGLVGMWRNVTPAVAVVANVNNYLLPLWMLGFGGWLVYVGRATKSGNV